MIHFRCSSCGKRFAMDEARVGKRLDCSCGQHLKVPRRSGASAKYRTWGDLFVEMLVYGLGGALLGFLLGAVLVSKVHAGGSAETLLFQLTLAALGLVLGTLCGERGVTWIGRKIRD